jgi:CDP-paratose 2-epimerase
MKVLITGSAGLVGSEAVIFYASQQHEVVGIDNNLRRYFFGPDGDTSRILGQLQVDFPNYVHKPIDIRNREAVQGIVREFRPDFILHTAAQPSHDWAAKEPFTDFDVNAVGTLNLLEAARHHCPNSVFVLLSTNKVYGDAPNHLPLKEMAHRYEYSGKRRGRGIGEDLSVDGCLHSLFGASKLAADVVTQEYGRYFNMPTGVFRGGCLTGSRHAGVALHGFLSYLIHCAVAGKPYTIIGYKGKQVRDQIHSSDVIQAVEAFRNRPRPGEAYNLGGGFQNSASILEVIALLEKNFDLRVKTNYQKTPRRGDHICYYTDLSKFKKHYPKFRLKRDLPSILEEMVAAERKHLEAVSGSLRSVA